MTLTFTLQKPVETIPAVLGLAKIAKLSFDGDDLTSLWQELETRVAQDETDVAALMDLCLIAQMRGQEAAGLELQAAALNECRIYRFPTNFSSPRLRLLGFAVAGNIGANAPIEFLLEGSDIELTVIYVVPGKPFPPIPDHDLAFVMVSESETSRAALAELEEQLAYWNRPVINPPALIPQVGREAFSEILRSQSNADLIEIPATLRVRRETLVGISRGTTPMVSVLPDGDFPVIVRPVDSHGGHGLARVTSSSELESYLAENANDEFFLSRFVDYASTDGLYRKYRVILVDGVPYPCHLGISEHWMIHFVNAGMIESESKRAEEARFMQCFDEEFGARHSEALAALFRETDLDYFGIDCAETPNGKLLIFEGDTGLVVHNMDSADIFPYKQPAMLELFRAFREMLYRKATQ